jgi:hypothetical protein
MQITLRLSTYLAIYIGYIYFMSLHAPLGITWMDFHAERMLIAVEFLQQNGLSKFGFIIWSVCSDCILEPNFQEGVYYSSLHAINVLPYFLIYVLGGEEAFIFFGPLLDKLIIFFCGVLISEIVIKCIQKDTRLHIFLIGAACFSMFALSPWVYKMFLDGWWEIYFVLFFLFGIFFFQNSKFKLGLLLFLFASFAQSIWGFLVGIFYLLILFLPSLFNRTDVSDKYFPTKLASSFQKISIILMLVFPQIFFASLKVIATPYLDFVTRSLFYRMGISGEDIHSGGILGAIQFLGGSRVTQCFGGEGLNILSAGNMALIGMYNCMFSIAGMALISILSIVGLYFLVKSSNNAARFFLPLIFSLLMFISVFQQSLSVHLMGYSFIFAVLFAAGMTKLMTLLQDRAGSSVMSIIFSVPSLAGILILSIRASMLTSMS